MKNHNYSFDILRILACFLVIVNHTNSSVFISMEPCLTWYISVAYFYLSKIAVPVFIMISGALLLKKDYTREQLCIKILKTIGLLLVFSTYHQVMVNGQPLDLVSMLTEPVITSLWYFYLLLRMYLFLPIIKYLYDFMVQRKWILHTFLAIWLLYACILPLAIRLEVIHIPFIKLGNESVFMFIGYMILGKIIADWKPSTKKIAFLTLSAVIICTSILCFSVLMTIRELKLWGQLYLQLDNPYYITTCINAILIFASIYHLFKNMKLPAFITKLAGLTYGIYLLHPILIPKMDYIQYDLLYFNNALASVVLFEIALFMASALFSWCLKHTLFIKDLF